MSLNVQQVLNNVQDIATWLNSGPVFDHTGSYASPSCYLPGNSGAGWEPAVHAYGDSGVAPGLWVNDGSAMSSQYLAPPQETERLAQAQFEPIVGHTQAGTFGPAIDVHGNVANWSGLPAGSNRLALVNTKGTNVSVWRKAGSSTDATMVDQSVWDFQAIDDTLVYALDQDGTLWRERGSAADRDGVDDRVVFFHALDASTVFVLAEDGTLWREQGDSSSRVQVDHR